MATRRATGGLAHPTVVPENFDPDADDADADIDGADIDGADVEAEHRYDDEHRA